MNNTLRDAIESRNPRALAAALLAYGNATLQTDALIELLNESTAGEIKRIRAWAEDWLSDTSHDNLRATGDARWQAMNSVYLLSRAVLQSAGLVRAAEGAP